MPLQEALRKELGTNPKAYIQETVERVDKIIEALNSDQLTAAERSSVQQYKEKLYAHTRKTLYELIALLQIIEVSQRCIFVSHFGLTIAITYYVTSHQFLWLFDLLPLMIICKNRKCGFRHPADLQMDKKAFRVAEIQHRSEKCPKCGKYDLYDKEDYFFSN